MGGMRCHPGFVCVVFGVLLLVATPSQALADHAGPLAGQWHLDAAQGGGPASTDDSSGHGLTASSGGPISIAGGGRFGNYLSESQASVLTAGPSPLLRTQRVTMIAWVRQNGVPPPYRYIAGQGDDGGTCLGSSYALYTGSNENPGLEFFIRPTTGNFRVSPAASDAVWDGLWHMVAGVYDGESVRLYVDGDQIGNGTPAPGLEINYGFSGDAFYFGGYPVGACGDGDFPGGIDEVRAYGRALSPTEIARLADAPGPEPPELVPDDFTPPETTILSGPADGEIVGDVPSRFEFGSTDPNATFECRTYDPDDPDAFSFHKIFTPCTSPHRRLDLFGQVDLGERTVFEVRAVDGAGNADSSPAVSQYVRHGTSVKKPRISECDLVKIKEAHGRDIDDRCRLAEIRNGKVGCVQVNSAHVERCEFDKANGRWLKSWTGREWAVVGDPISLDEDGKAKYVVAARIGEKDESPCARLPRSSNRDSAGVMLGNELATACVVELMGSSWNATGLVLDNYATREVCTSSFPHPDGTDFRDTGFVTSPEPGVYCYRGIGAALNDSNGTERGQDGRYLTGSARCHVVWANGYEVFAAKRPAMRSYPAPARIDPHSPIVWRPMADNARISN